MMDPGSLASSLGAALGVLKPTKARLKCVGTNLPSGVVELECMFNPTEYRIAQSARVSRNNTAAKAVRPFHSRRIQRRRGSAGSRRRRDVRRRKRPEIDNIQCGRAWGAEVSSGTLLALAGFWPYRPHSTTNISLITE